MQLILQSISATQQTLHSIATLAHPQQILDVAPGVVRCTGPALSMLSGEEKEKIGALAFSENIDFYWKESTASFSDFKLLAMDMDSTLITIECIDEIADMQGLKPQVAVITESAMRGEIPFAESLIRRVALLKGLPAAVLQQVCDVRLKYSPGAEKMLHAVRAAGLKTLLVSGGFTFFTDRVMTDQRLDFNRANQLEIIDGELTGRVIGTIIDAEEKRRTVEQICTRLGIATAQTIVMGDGANDLAMMRIAGLSVAFRAKPVVRKKADAALNFVGLDGLLNLL